MDIFKVVTAVSFYGVLKLVLKNPDSDLSVWVLILTFIGMVMIFGVDKIRDLLNLKTKEEDKDNTKKG